MQIELRAIPHERPCNELTGHLQEHKDNIKSWKDRLRGGVIELVKIAIVAIITACACIFGFKGGQK